MAERKFYVDINLLGNQLKNGVVHKSSGAPTDITAKEGQLYYDDVAKLLYIFDGTSWKPVGDIPQFEGDVINTGLDMQIQAGKVGTSELANSAVSTIKIGDNQVDNDKLADMPANTIKGNNTGALSDPKDLTAAEVAAMIGFVAGDQEANLVESGVTETTVNVLDNTSTTFAMLKAASASRAGLMTKAMFDDLTDAKADIITNAGDITTNAGNISTNTGDITALDVRVTANEGDIITNAAAIAAIDVVVSMTPGDASVVVNGTTSYVKVADAVNAGLITPAEKLLIGSGLQGVNLALHIPENENTVIIDNDSGTGLEIPTADGINAGVMSKTLYDLLGTSVQNNDIGFGYNQATATTNTLTISGLSDIDRVVTINSAIATTKAGLLSGADKKKLDDLQIIDPTNIVFKDETDLSTIDWISPAADLGGATSSDNKVPTQLAVKTYVTNVVSGIGEFRGSYHSADDTTSGDISKGLDGRSPKHTDIVKGDYWIVDDTGTFFGAAVAPGVRLIANITNADVAGDWTVVRPTFNSATEDIEGQVELADDAEALAGTLHESYAITPKTLKYVLTNGSTVNKKAAVLIGDGSQTAFAIPHLYGDDVMVVIKIAATGEEVFAEVVQSSNSVTVTFNSAPATDEFRVVIVG